MSTLHKYLSCLLPILFMQVTNLELTGQIQSSPGDYLRFVWEVKPDSAAVALQGFLNDQNDQVVQEGLWLEAAILWARTDSIRKAEDQYQRWLSGSSGRLLTREERANVLLYQAIFIRNQGNLGGAIDSLHQSLPWRDHKTKKDSLVLADTYTFLGRFYRYLTDYPESAKFFSRAIEINRLLNRSKGVADDLTDLSHVQTQIDPNATEIVKGLNEALEIYTDLGEPLLVAAVYNQLGALYSFRSEHTNSLTHFQKSLQIKLTHRGERIADLDVAWNNVAYAHMALNQPEQGRYYFERALEFAKTTSKKLFPYFMNLGITFAQQENYPKALELMQLSIAALDPSLDPHNWKSNPQNLIQSTILAEYLSNKANTLLKFAHQEDHIGYFEAALETSMISLNMMDTIRFLHSFESKRIFSREMRDYYLLALRIAIDLYEKTETDEYLYSAFNLSGRNKSAVLNEFIRENAARKLLGPQAPWIIAEDSLKRMQSHLESRLHQLEQGEPQPDTIAMVIGEFNATQEALKRLSIDLRKHHPEYYQMMYTRSGFSAEELRASLQPDQTLLEYTIDKDKLYCFALTRDTLVLHSQRLEPVFYELVDDLVSGLIPFPDNRTSSRYAMAAAELYRYLIQPLESQFKGKRLLIIPDQVIGLIPFESLIREFHNPEPVDFRTLDYLNLHYSIGYYYSQEQLAHQSSAKSSQTFGKVYAFAPFTDQKWNLEGGILPRLEYSGEEIDAVKSHFITRRYKGVKATETAFRSSVDKQAILHFSSHAVMDPLKPMTSKLIFHPAADDYEFFFFELLGIRIQSPLVVLNACNTGSGKMEPGEGVLSMARGFQYAGVNSMITTLWPVEDRSSTRIMSSFYKYLKSGTSKTESMRLARIDYLNECKVAESSPYFWAAHIVLGEDTPLQYRPNYLVWIWLIVAGLLLSGLLLLVKKILVLQSKSKSAF